MSSSSSISAVMACGLVADPDDLLGLDPGGVAGLLGGGVEALLGFAPRLLDHRLADADPFEIVRRIDHRQHDHAGAGAARRGGTRSAPPAGIPASSSITTMNFGR